MEAAAAGGRSMRPGEHLEGAPTVRSGVERAEMLLIESDLRDGRHSGGRERQGGPGEKSQGVAGGVVGARRGGWRLGREEGRSSSITPESLDFFPKARKQHGQRLEATLAACGVGWRDWPGCREALGWCPTWGGSSRGGSRWIGAMFGKHQLGLAGRLQVGEGKGWSREGPLVEWMMVPSLRWRAWHLVWERNTVTAQSWKEIITHHPRC